MATKKVNKTHPQKKDKYRIRNWKEYNQSLINRGSITFWFSEETIQNWYSCERLDQPGRPKTYSDDTIRCGLMIRAVFRVALRQLQGLITSIIGILKLNLICPHYSRFSRRSRDLKIPLRKLLKPGEHLNIIFDSTGIKVYGEGEWKVRKHGYSKRRTWRKIHVGMCADTGQIVVQAITTNNVSDDAAMVQMMDLLDDIPIGDVLGDGAYDTIDCREAIYFRRGRQIIPPKRTARAQRKKRTLCLKERNEAIERIKELGEEGRTEWKKEVNYHRRSLVETHMFRHKIILGDRLSSRGWLQQVTEVGIRMDVLNKMLELGRPKSYKVIS